jgi:hypothetical protein
LIFLKSVNPQESMQSKVVENKDHRRIILLNM